MTVAYVGHRRRTRPMEARGRAATHVFGAVDLGTNNCRLLIARAAPDGFRVIDGYSRIVRLGEGIGATGCLSEAADDPHRRRAPDLRRQDGAAPGHPRALHRHRGVPAHARLRTVPRSGRGRDRNPPRYHLRARGGGARRSPAASRCSTPTSPTRCCSTSAAARRSLSGCASAGRNRRRSSAAYRCPAVSSPSPNVTGCTNSRRSITSAWSTRSLPCCRSWRQRIRSGAIWPKARRRCSAPPAR